jgi:regulation of enolase protein 1 (concanavalin A-like superfamily)
MNGSWPPLVRVCAIVALVSALPALAGAQTATTPGTLSSYSTIYSIGIEWDIAGDSDHDATSSIQYRPAAGGDWKQGLAPLRIDYNSRNMVAGSILFLTPDTEYVVRVSLSDPDGGGDTREIRVRTRRLPTPPSGGRIFHVVPGGGGGSGTTDNPFRGVAAAQTVARPGDTFLLHAGNYGGRIVFTVPGTPDTYVAWRAAGDGEVTMAGIDIGASHVWLEGLTVRGQQYGTRTLNAPTNVVITRSFFYDNDYAIFLTDRGSYWYIADNTIVGIHPAWTASFDGEGIDLLDTDGHTVAHNSITSVGDGISYPRTNVDIFGNDIFDTSDDGIELDLGRANVRVWGNRVHNPHHNGISFQPQSGGPWYIVRNQIVGGNEAPLKFRVTDRFVLLHNTMVKWGGYMFSAQANDIQKAFSRNNLWVSVTGGQMWGLHSHLRDWRTSLDYDGFDWGAAEYPWVWDDVIYYDLRSFSQASGHQRNGIQISKEACFHNFQMYGPAPTPVPPHVMSLQPGCNAVDAGVALPNINEGFLGAAPDMGAHEYGAPAPHYGLRGGNRAPTVTLTSPSTGASYTAPGSVTLSAAASDADGSIARVDFYAGGTHIASDTTPPYTTTWSNVPAGTYVLSAHATDNSGAVATSAGVSITVHGETTSPLPSLPSGWSQQDIGSVAIGGTSGYAGGAYTVTGAGTDIWGTSDEFRFVSLSLTGDGTIVARVDAFTAANEWAKAGVMMRESLAAGSKHASMFLTPSHNGPAFQRRVATGGSTTSTGGGSGTAPAWVRVERAGNRFTASHSLNGTSWTVVGSETISMAATIQVGLAVTSHDPGSLASAAFSSVSIDATIAPAPSPDPAPDPTPDPTPGTGLPDSWQTQAIGGAGGSAGVNGNTWSLQAAGTDIWGTSDEFRFAYRTLTGDGSIVARVDSLAAADPWAKVGVMMRGSLAGGGTHASMFVTPAANGLAFQRRTSAGGGSLHTAAGSRNAPVWVRIERSGSRFTASHSIDGSSWTTVGSETISMDATIYVGLALTSHDAGALAAATFSQVSVGAGTAPPPEPAPQPEPEPTPDPGSGLPASWTAQDIGSVGVAGSVSVQGGSWTLRASGADIWGTADGFHFAYRTLSGDGSIVARVSNVQHTNEWAKAGLMMRGALSAGAVHGSIFLTPDGGNGVAFQRRSSAGGSSLHTSGGSSSGPVWLRLTRSGNTIVAARSADGSSWTEIGRESIPMGTTIYVGVAATSHEHALLGSATFDAVSVGAADSGGEEPVPGSWTTRDIGSVSAQGSATQTASGWTVTGSGADIWNESDAFRYVYRTVSGDFSIVTRVASLDYVDPWTKAGLMVRASTTAGSAHVSLFATPTSANGVAFQRRRSTGASSIHTAGPNVAPDVWLRLTRTGGTITAAYRRSSGEAWTTIASESSAALGSSVLVGLAVTSHADGSLATAAFDNLTFP